MNDFERRCLIEYALLTETGISETFKYKKYVMATYLYRMIEVEENFRQIRKLLRRWRNE